jgi:5-methylcytosine-specific restriction endonuclease McrA
MNKEWEKIIWFKEHNDYLRSNKWHEKRDAVLKRDNYLCQACLIHRATQVHHLSYEHWRNEPLFELVSICKDCHDLITKIDQKK